MKSLKEKIEALSGFLEKWKNISIATKADNMQLINLAKNMPMKAGELEISYDHGELYEAFPQLIGDSHIILVWRNSPDKSTEIVGTATIVFSNKNISGRECGTAYFSSLRLSESMNLRVRAQWRKQYGEIIEIIKNDNAFSDIEFLYTAVLDKNMKALNAFTKSKSFEYRKFTTYTSVSVVAKIPILNRVAKTLRFGRDKILISEIPIHADDAFRFLTTQIEKATLSPVLKGDQVILQRETEKDYSKHYQVKIAGEIVGIFKTSSTDKSRSIRLLKVSSKIKLFNLLLVLLGRKPFKENKKISVLNIDLFTVSSELCSELKTDVVREILEFLLSSKEYRGFHTINFIEPFGFLNKDSDFLRRKLVYSGFVFHVEKGSVFEVSLPGDPYENKLEQKNCNALLEVGLL